ncbi:MAG: ParB/RepB/Spo0J family partition protein [Termitinemataceae bacterium]|nr:MAG: ParB/RepB/Spo0J family partition protein [Termitinemataceae bacterium]
MPKTYGLGRGADALFGDNHADKIADYENDGALSSNGGARAAEINIAIEKIVANPDQPRKSFDETSLNELAASIKENGVIQPIIVEGQDDGFYRIVAGERRFRAAKIAELIEIPAIIRNYTETERYAVSLIENIQRSDLNPIEEALAYRQIMENAGLSQDETAARVGKNRSTLANSLRLLKLPQNVQNAIKDGNLSAGHARAVLSVEDDVLREKLFAQIIEGQLSVRDAEKLAADLNKNQDNAGDTKKAAGNEKPAGKVRDPELGAMQQRFLERLGTKVSIEGTLEKGCIKIDYYTGGDLDRINDILCGE